ncbi:glycerophosphodiester phosphodiesterase [Brumimicrobium aurantiacum]|uniref:GP-PDE domain-containing protein n=1 Tax=Brumimicrobium aurantiacum TaxID=1737063 RepID=A0A3E1EYH8_9FLAO|nr:glycerophosphodiester phosphodiesterase family protein [Brumimicrobium aurantiacum]RFC54587.1 hypothetical protein DXU93_06245 [Brumimicrobium aurantiacum]
MRITLLFIGLTVVFLSCQKNDFNISNLNGNKITVLGHGGMGIGHSYPMNSQESILNCLNLGTDGTEIDVQMTKDGVLVAYHDETLDTKTNSTGKIHEKTWDEISDVQYTTPHFNGYRLVRLESLFQNIEHLKEYIFFLDLKNFNTASDTSYYATMLTEVNNLIVEFDLLDNIYVESKNEGSIAALQSINSKIQHFAYAEYEKALQLAEEHKIVGITLPFDELTEERITLLHEKGIMVATFNTHSKKRNIRAVQFNVDFIQTDKVKHLVKILE